MFDFRRITLFCLEKRLSKCVTTCSKNFGGAWPLWPRLCSATVRTQRIGEMRSCSFLIGVDIALTAAIYHLVFLLCTVAHVQGRPLADWTDCFQSGPAPKGAPRYASLCGTHSFLSVGPVANENQSGLRSILTSSFIIIRSGIVTVVIDFDV